MARSCPWELLGLPQLKSAKPTRYNIAYRNSMSSEGAMKCVVADINSGHPPPLAPNSLRNTPWDKLLLALELGRSGL